jgi:hypothetical protein
LIEGRTSSLGLMHPSYCLWKAREYHFYKFTFVYACTYDILGLELRPFLFGVNTNAYALLLKCPPFSESGSFFFLIYSRRSEADKAPSH